MTTNGFALKCSPSDEDNLLLQRPKLANSTSNDDRPTQSRTSDSPDKSNGSLLNGIGVQHTSVSNTVEKAAKMLEMLMKERQQIFLKGNDSEVTHGVHSCDVDVIVKPNMHTDGSNKVKIKNVVAYSWEHKYYNGNIVAIHMNGSYMAYSLKITGKNESCVRVVNRKTTERGLVKGMQGQVKDLSFAHSANQIVLAIIDEAGTVFIYHVTENEANNAIKCNLILHVNRARPDKCDYRRVSWCHYHPDESPLDDLSDETNMMLEDYSKLLAVTHDETVEMLHLDAIDKERGIEVTPIDFEGGYQKIVAHTKPITEALFAPDGSALATASLDGQVKFFQVYFHAKGSSPRCLHQWEPHGGKPVTALFFLDNHKNPKPDQSYWKFAITGSDENREIKIWCCVEWTCLQTIRFEDEINQLQPCLKACLDLSAEYLLLSDINRRVLYILQFHQEPDVSKACIVSLSEFPLTFPMLSFAIRQAGVKMKPKLSDPSDNLETEEKYNNNNEEDVAGGLNGADVSQEEETILKLLIVQPKSLQECFISFPTSHFLPQKNGDDSCITTMSQESIASYRDGLSDLSIDRTNDVSIIEEALPATPSLADIKPPADILLTPDSFTSQSVNHSGSTLAEVSPSSFGTSSSGTVVNTSDDHSSNSLPLSRTTSNDESEAQHADIIGPLIDINEQQPLATSARVANLDVDVHPASNGIQKIQPPHSASSSPSREVAQILSSPESNSPEYKKIDVDGKSQVEVENYKPTVWPAAPNINKIAQQPPTSELPMAHQNNSNSELLKELALQRKTNEDFIQEFKLREKKLDVTVQAMLSVLQDQQEELKKQKSAMDHLKEEVKKQSTFKHDPHQDMKLKQIIESCLMGRYEQEKRNHEQTMTTISQVVVNTIEAKLQKSLKSEIKNSVVPVMSKVLEPAVKQMQVDMSQKISLVETSLKENISNLIKSKSTVDAIGSEVGTAVHGQVVQAYHDSFQNIFFPSFEKTSQIMFQQLNEHFQRGTKDYLSQVENQMKKKREADDKIYSSNKAQLQSIDERVKSLNNSVESQHRMLANIQKAMSGQEETLRCSVLSAMRSGAVTPVPAGSLSANVDHQTQKQQIEMLLKQGQVNAAFQQALSASDLSLVILVCESVDPNIVFSQKPCPLDQPIVLSLIQQLSTDLSSQTDLKYRYLSEALMNVDSKHAVTRDHLPAILAGVREKFEMFINTSTNSNLTKKMKILLMAAKSL